MKLIEFKTTDEGKRMTLFINPEHIESILVLPQFKDKIKIGLISGTTFMVDHSLDEVNELIGIEKTKRPARRVT